MWISIFVYNFFIITYQVIGENKSGLKPNVISLPSGPGSIEGLGERFEPRLNSGTSSYKISLSVPPGRAGFSPALALTYDSGYGNGPFGIGWRIDGIPYIGRQTEGRQPFYTDYPDGDSIDNDQDNEMDEFDEFDTFFYNGQDELVPTKDGSWRYRTEENFIRLRRVDGGWVATRKDGVTLKFGSTSASRVQGPTGQIYMWCLDLIGDTHDNQINFT